jgi:hypothetical protein
MARSSNAFTETDPRAMEVWLQLLRAKAPDDGLAMKFELSDFAVGKAQSGVRSNYPEASEQKIFLRTAALRLPRQLMIRTRGWDPADLCERNEHTR